MPKGYWIGRLDVIDPDKYNEYVVAAAIPFRKYGARFIVAASSTGGVQVRRNRMAWRCAGADAAAC
jgi:uncharacterized protein (DUF1330 family)